MSCGGCGGCNDCSPCKPPKCPDSIVSLTSDSPFVTKLKKIASGDCGDTWELDVDAEITSSDNTINVEKDGNTFDLTTNCCDNEDKLVAVTEEDTPGLLRDKIVSCDENYLSIDVVGPTDNRQLLFCVKKAEEDSDELVKYRKGCDAVYGEDLNVSKDQSVLIDKTGCNDSFYLNPEHFRVPFARRYMSADYIVEKKAGPTHLMPSQGWFYAPFDLAVPDVTGEIGTIIQTFNLPGSPRNIGTIVIPKTGFYSVSIEGSVDINYAINAFRCILFATSAPYVLIDSKYGAPVQSPLNDISTDYTGVNNGQMKQYEVGGFKTFLLPKGTVIFAGGRMDNSVSDNQRTNQPWEGKDKNGVLCMRHAGLAGGGLVENDQLLPQAGFSFEVKRVCGPDGDIRYK